MAHLRDLSAADQYEALFGRPLPPAPGPTFQDADPFTGTPWDDDPWGDVTPEKDIPQESEEESGWGPGFSLADAGPGAVAVLSKPRVAHLSSPRVLPFSGGTSPVPPGCVVRAWWVRERRAILWGGLRQGAADPRNLRRLARELRWRGIEVGSEAFAAMRFAEACVSLGLDPASTADRLAGEWDGITSTPERNVFALACRLADRDGPQVAAEYGLKLHYGRVLALAKWLGLLARQQWSAFPVAKIAEWLWDGCTRQTAGRYVRTLDEAGLLEIRRGADGKAAYSYTAREAREVRFIGGNGDAERRGGEGERTAPVHPEGHRRDGAAGRGQRVAAARPEAEPALRPVHGLERLLGGDPGRLGGAVRPVAVAFDPTRPEGGGEGQAEAETRRSPRPQAGRPHGRPAHPCPPPGAGREPRPRPATGPAARGPWVGR